MKRFAVLVTILGVVVVGGAFAATMGLSMFLGATEGMAVPIEVLSLPPLADPGGPTGEVLDRDRFPKCAAFAPSNEQLLGGNTIITSEAQMRLIWSHLFAEPYDPDLFDFNETFVRTSRRVTQHSPEQTILS